jgi:hypothetical protein
MPTDPWIIVPVVNNLDLTRDAVADALAQEGMGGPCRVLLVGNGCAPEVRAGLEELQEIHHPRVLLLPHQQPLGGPPFGCLNASWNYALDFCWELGADRVLVVNNDVRLHPQTYACLYAAMVAASALFVSAVGVQEADWVKIDPREACYDPGWWMDGWDRQHKGGPDFSCFLISKECHRRFRFDPGFTFWGDNHTHRMLVLAGEGERIFGVNVPYLHYGSQTLRRNPEFAEKYRAVADTHRARYIEIWGGPPGEEKYLTPYDRGENLWSAESRSTVLADVRKLQCERPPLR